jgi:hypothetical protein
VELLYINVIMLITFLVMGYLSPKFNKSARDGEVLLRRWTPVSVALLMFIAAMGSRADWYMFALYCISAWPLSVTHPLVGQRSQSSEAGRAIAFFNLLLFVGVFFWQWSFGSVVSWLSPSQGVEAAYQIAMGVLAGLSAIGYLIFVVPGKALTVDSLEAQTLGATPKHNT